MANDVFGIGFKLRIGILFIISSILLFYYAQSLQSRFLSLIFTWASMSFGLIGFSYWLNKPQLFGKSKNGKQNNINITVLLPYLIYLWGMWYILRLIKTENPIDQIDETIFIGRRVLKKELSEEIETVVDLTCEFPEDQFIVQNTDYHNFPILDASIPKPDELASFIKKISKINNPIFIHCAEGHGRTALIAVLILIAKGKANTASDAFKILKMKRPLVRLNKAQKECAEKTLKLLQ